jgi:pyruvate, water dikinase
MTHARRLDELSGADSARYGGKSASLGELLRAGIPVPPGFALSTTAFDEFVESSGLADRMAAALAGVGASDVEALARASHVIAEAMRSAPVPLAVREEVAEQYAALTGGDEAPPVAVRSSALGEDSGEATFAGQQDTYLWVRGADEIGSAIRDCWASLYNTQAISYRARLGGDAGGRPAMGVTVQLMVDAAVSGVMFTCNPVTGDPSMVAVNAGWGLGLAVVGGEVTPDDYLVSKVTREIVREHVHDKEIEYQPAPGGRGTVQVPVSAERRTAPCLDAELLATLVDLSKRIERHFGGHQDVEWAIDRGGELYVLQSRPVTALPTREVTPGPASAISLVMQKFGAGG